MTNRTTEELVGRLREAHANSVQRCLGSDIFGEAATLIEQLREERDALLQRPMDLAKMDSADDDVPEKMLAYYWCEQAREARAEREQLLNRVERLEGELKTVLPRNVCLTNRNIPDSMIVPLETTMGELRKIAALTGEHPPISRVDEYPTQEVGRDPAVMPSAPSRVSPSRPSGFPSGVGSAK